MAQPAIYTMTPGNGTVGSSVVISGTGFSSIPSLNIVNFSGVRAMVTNATSDLITVTVPYGTSPYVPVSVTTGGLTAYSQVPFITTSQYLWRDA